MLLPRFLVAATGLGRLKADVNNCNTVGRLLLMLELLLRLLLLVVLLFWLLPIIELLLNLKLGLAGVVGDGGTRVVGCRVNAGLTGFDW